MLLPPDFSYCGGSGSNDISSSFRHFDYFLLFTALKREFIRLYDIFFSPYTLSTNNFISRQLFAALASPVPKMHTSIRLGP
jgi:hypothetical protein